MQAKRKPRKHISTLYNLKGNIFPDFFQLTTLLLSLIANVMPDLDKKSPNLSTNCSGFPLFDKS